MHDHIFRHKVTGFDKRLKDLAAKEAIQKAPPSREGFTNPLFLVPKSDGSWHPVINLKALNKYIITRHFKMESVRTVKGLMQKGDWLVKLNMKDTYLLVPIHSVHQKFLKFQLQGLTSQFQSLPFDINSAMYTFTDP